MAFAKEIAAAEVYDLRQRVLRPGRPTEECVYSGDDGARAFHIGTFLDASDLKNIPELHLSEDELPKLVSVSSYFEEGHKYFPKAQKPFRLRGMATEPALQGKGYGAIAIKVAEPLLIAKGCDLLWFNAREIAFGFYEKLGFKFKGDLFEIPHIGPHKVMFKEL